MSSTETRQLIVQAVERLEAEVPALRRLKLVVKLELTARGGDAPIWRVEVPGPNVGRDPAADARLQITVARSQFNELAKEGRLSDWMSAYARGSVRVTGEHAVVKLLGNVVERTAARARG